MSSSFTIYEAGTSLDWDGDTKVSLYIFDTKDIIFVGYLAILVLEVTKRQSCLMPRLVCPILILNIVSVSRFFLLGKVFGLVRLRTSFILSSQSWEIGCPPTGGAGRMKLSCVVPALGILI